MNVIPKNKIAMTMPILFLSLLACEPESINSTDPVDSTAYMPPSIVPVEDIVISSFRRVGGPGGATFDVDDDDTIITDGDDEEAGDEKETGDDSGDGATGDDSGDENPDDDGSAPSGGGVAGFG